MSTAAHTITRVTRADADDLLALMRAYCDFYEASPADEDLIAIIITLLDDPEREGVQLLARDGSGGACGFATVYWSWSTTSACRIGIMNDLFVAPHARARGIAEALIEACRSVCADRGAPSLQWQTAPENLRAQAVYDRVGGTRSQWIDYSLPVGSSPDA